MGERYLELLCPVSRREGVQRIVVAKRFDLSVQSEDAPQGWSILKQVTGKKLFFFYF